jgi:hypothetical protein
MSQTWDPTNAITAVRYLIDITALGMKNWRNVAMNREHWLKLLKKARAHTGLLSH